MSAVRPEYDYIVVGGGTAGSVMAARLSQDENIAVLLLEAGAGEPLDAMAIPRAWLSLLGSTAVWGDTGAVNTFTEMPVPTPRGRALGGSSSINGLNFLRAHRSSYDLWPTMGAPGWGFDDLLPFFQRSETCLGGDPAIRGTSGPLTVSTPPEPTPLIAAAIDAGVELGFGRAADLSSGLEIGFGWTDFNIVDGVRQSAADAYLSPAMHRPNLDIVTDALVRRVIIDDGRCTGVEYSTGGVTSAVSCNAEVVLCAGAIGSAQLLMLSGIGPVDHLRAVGIEPRLELPGVGANLHDHPFATVSYSARQAIEVNLGNAPGEGVGFVRTDASLDGPDLQFVLISLPIPIAGLTQPEEGYSIAFSIMAPYSRGSVRLASSDADVLPVVDPNYLGDPRDIATMYEGLRIARQIGQGGALQPWRGQEIHPGPDVRDTEELREYLRHSLKCYFHYVGTCRMGTDEMAVVDSQLRVRGITDLRVADASVMPAIVAANTNATVYAIAERAADLVMQSRRSR
jgi:choline dehydrogenase